MTSVRSLVLGTGLALGAVLVAVPALAAGNAVLTSPPSGYIHSPTAYMLSGGHTSVTFTYTVTNQSGSAISGADVRFVADHIRTYKGVDISDGQPGQPGISEAEFGQNFAQTQQDYNIIDLHKTLPTLAPGASVTMSFTGTLSMCGYYQLDSFPSNQQTGPAGLFATGFIRVLGCGEVQTVAATPTPTATPTPSSTPTPTGTPTPNGQVSPATLPTTQPSGNVSPVTAAASVQPNSTNGGGVGGASANLADTTAPAAAQGVVLAATGAPIGLALAGLLLLLAGGMLIARRRRTTPTDL